jgi:HTH-type transcriptional regulator / antitoxin HipB
MSLIAAAEQFGEVLRSRRKLVHVSQKTMAAKLGISQSRLSALETDSSGLTVERLLALANILGLEVVLREKAVSSASASRIEW